VTREAYVGRSDRAGWATTEGLVAVPVLRQAEIRWGTVPLPGASRDGRTQAEAATETTK
jgi:hypothetical protein